MRDILADLSGDLGSFCSSFSVRCCQQALVKDDLPGHLHLAAAHQHMVRRGILTHIQ